MIGIELDTSAREVEHYYALLRKLAPTSRMKAAVSACQRVRRFTEAGLRMRFPKANDTEIKIRLTAHLYGRAVAIKLHGNVPDDLK